jgi:hypothetical protein
MNYLGLASNFLLASASQVVRITVVNDQHQLNALPNLVIYMDNESTVIGLKSQDFPALGVEETCL